MKTEQMNCDVCGKTIGKGECLIWFEIEGTNVYPLMLGKRFRLRIEDADICGDCVETIKQLADLAINDKRVKGIDAILKQQKETAKKILNANLEASA